MMQDTLQLQQPSVLCPCQGAVGGTLLGGVYGGIAGVALGLYLERNAIHHRQKSFKNPYPSHPLGRNHGKQG